MTDDPSTGDDRIHGQVARLLNSRELVINRGRHHGVIVGMRFAVLNRKGINITDPVTGEPLGSLEIPKTFVKVIQSHEMLSVARTFREFRSEGGSMWSALQGLSTLSEVSRPPERRVETLKTTESLAEEDLDEKDSYVKVGDPVVQVVNDDAVGATGPPAKP